MSKKETIEGQEATANEQQPQEQQQPKQSADKKAKKEAADGADAGNHRGGVVRSCVSRRILNMMERYK